MTDLPGGWALATLQDVASWSSGGTPKTGTAAYYGGDIPWAVIGDLNDSRVVRTAACISATGLANSSAKVVPTDTTLIAMYGASIGKLGIAALPMATNQAIACAQSLGGLARGWLFWWLRACRQDLRDAGKGGAQPNISQGVLRSWPIPVAPAAEQERIVTAIEEAFSKLDAGEAALRTTRQRLKRLRESVLTAAVTGRLVPQDPTDEPASKLLANLGAARCDSDGLPDLPHSWEWARLGAMGDVVGGVTKDAKRQDDADFIEVPYLRVANVQRGFLDLGTVATIRVSVAAAQKMALIDGDVLFNEGGDRDKLGRGWVWEGQVPDCIHQNHVFRCRLAGGMQPKLVSWWGNTFGKGWFETHGKQTTNLASLNMTTLKSFPIPVAPVNEQERIVAAVEYQFSFLEACERTVDAGLVRSAAMRRSILKAAFEGRLAAQDPSDEPASVLLERLRAERDAIGKTTTPPRAQRPQALPLPSA
jgi:type I restriction enzyme, S subunit